MVFYYKNLALDVGLNVYSPAEDSILLADSLDVNGGERVLDVGTGSGIIALSAAEFAGSVLGVDVDPQAVSCARKNAVRNGIGNAEFRVSDLFENVEGKFDLIIFNPPYLPSGSIKDKAVDGGRRGRQLIRKFIADAGDHLNPEGRILILVSSLNEPEKIIKNFGKNGFEATKVAEKKLSFEKLFVLSAKKKIG